MELRHIRYFIAVAEAKSLTKATEHLHVAQPALSQNIKALEGELGVNLFTRTRLGVSLTDEGTKFLTHAYEVMRHVNRAQMSVQETAADPRGVVSIALPASVSNAIAVRLYQLIATNIPNVQITVEEGLSGTLVERFNQGLFDVLVDFDTDISDELRIEPLLREELYFVHAGSLNEITEGDVSLTDIQPYKLSLPSPIDALSRAVTRFTESEGIKLQSAPHTNTMHSAINLIQAGLTTGILPWSAIHRMVGPDLIAHRIVKPAMHRTVNLITRVSRPRSIAINRVMEMIRLAVVQAVDGDQWRGELFIDRREGRNPSTSLEASASTAV